MASFAGEVGMDGTQKDQAGHWEVSGLSSRWRDSPSEGNAIKLSPSRVRVRLSATTSKALVIPSLPYEILVSIFRNIDDFRAALEFSSTCRDLLFLSSDPHAIAKWIMAHHNRYLALPTAVEMIKDKVLYSPKAPVKGKKAVGKKVPSDASSAPYAELVRSLAPLEFEASVVKSLIAMGAEVSRAIVQNIKDFQRVTEQEGILQPVSSILAAEGMKLYGKPTTVTKVESMGVDPDSSDDSDDEDGPRVFWLSEYFGSDDVAFRHALASYPHHKSVEEAYDIIFPIVNIYRYTPMLEELSPTFLRRLYSLGADIFDVLMERLEDRSGNINRIIAMTCFHRTEGELGEWPVVLSDRFYPEVVFGIPKIANSDANGVNETESDEAPLSPTSSEVELNEDELITPLPAALAKPWTCYVTEEMVEEILENRTRNRDYRSTYKLLSRLLTYDALNSSDDTYIPKVYLNTPFTSLLETAFRKLIVEGRHLGAQALFEEFHLPVSVLESAVLEHLQSKAGCYYPGGVYMVNWSVGIRGSSEDYRRLCAVEVTRGILKPRLHGKARSALEMCFYRVAGVPWNEDMIPEDMRVTMEGESSLPASSSSSVLNV
ncbi:hypothetical protein BC829DRAFT_419505 [Chytridium lagenaria]|nr:hypothetical protein BC829DRAFT_419505 [Chytridium lagenaria]